MRSLRLDEVSPKRRLAVRLLRAGLITPAEAARELHVSRQLVQYWMKNVNTALARERRVLLLFDLLADTPWATADHARDIPGFQDLTDEHWTPPT